ncbi:unnamed protein product [Ectocarpus sp. 12 AP-2014]
MLRLGFAAIVFTTLCGLSGIATGSPALTFQQQWTDTRLHGVPVLPLVQRARGGAGQDGVPKELGAGLRPRESYHLSRKTFHFSTIMAFAVVYSAKLTQRDFARGMAALDACVLAGELARLRMDVVNRALFRVFGAFMRAHELKKFSGIMYCLAGLGITSAMFPKHIALLGMLQLALGDPVAALCGHATRSVGWSRVGTGKGLLGALGCATALTLANSFVLAKATFGSGAPTLRRIVLAGGMIAAWAAAVEVSVPSPQKTLPFEGFPLAFDDNAALPVLGAMGAAVVFRVLGLGSCELRPWLLG